MTLSPREGAGMNHAADKLCDFTSKPAGSQKTVQIGTFYPFAHRHSPLTHATTQRVTLCAVIYVSALSHQPFGCKSTYLFLDSHGDSATHLLGNSVHELSSELLHQVDLPRTGPVVAQTPGALLLLRSPHQRASVLSRCGYFCPCFFLGPC